LACGAEKGRHEGSSLLFQYEKIVLRNSEEELNKRGQNHRGRRKGKNAQYSRCSLRERKEVVRTYL